VPDGVDACPDLAGVPTNDPKTNGCPPDEDGVGIDDLRDACPTIPGIATTDPRTNGCPEPDRDKDGILDEEDACPDEKGERDVDPHRNGCPKAVVRGDRIVVFDPIQWKAGTAELVASPENEALLTAVLAAALKVPSTLRFRIEGHTDDRLDRKVGAARAAAVMKWLSEHGIDAARLASEGLGAQRPVATNETEAGRAENRRIEIHLVP
jgi:outer membrane protein OmpA-like peptidoglycan-associated protein